MLDALAEVDDDVVLVAHSLAGCVIPVVALLLLAPTAAFAENTEPPKPVKPLVKVKDEAAVKALESFLGS